MKRVLILLLISLFLIGSASAVPMISNVSGTVADGEVLTINGASLLNEDTTNWFYTTGSFEGSDVNADGFTCSSRDCTYETNIKILGNKSFRSDASYGGGATCGGNYLPWYGDMISTGTHSGAQKFARVYVRYDSNLAEEFAYSYYIKNMYYMTGGVYLGWTYQYGWPQRVTLKVNAPTLDLDLPEQWRPDKWYCLELEADHNTNTGRAWIDGIFLGSLTNSFFLDNDPNSFELGIINACYNGTIPVSGEAYYDGFAESSTRIYPAAIIEVGDNPVYGSGNQVVQEVVHLDDNSIQIEYSESGYNLSGNSVSLTGTDKYLWITDNQQIVSSTYNLLGVVCIHISDEDCNGTVDINELLDYIGRWKNNEVGIDIGDIIDSISYWKNN